MKKKNVILIHIAIWTLLFISNLWGAYSGHFFKPETGGIPVFLKYFILETGYIAIPVFCFYTGYGWVAKPLFVSKQFVKAFLYFLLSIIGAVAVRYAVEYFVFLPVLGFDNYRGQQWPAYAYISNVFFYYFPRYFVYGLMYFFGENWYKARHQQQLLEKERTAAELALLRSQINPHFLFNAINDIYSLSYHKSDQAPLALLKLSEILRYTLHESKTEVTHLKDEIKYLENVIELQRISAKGNIYVDFAVEGDINTQRIPSLLLIVFVENAFKHGVINDPDHPVTIKLAVKNNEVDFSVSNKAGNYQKDKTGGIGLNNAKRRLELLSPGKYHLAIADNTLYYNVNLTLQTN